MLLSLTLKELDSQAVQALEIPWTTFLKPGCAWKSCEDVHIKEEVLRDYGDGTLKKNDGMDAINEAFARHRRREKIVNELHWLGNNHETLSSLKKATFQMEIDKLLAL